MIKTLSILIISAIVFTGCATTSNTNRTIIPVSFSAQQYNSIANKYIESLTVVEYALMNNGKSWLSITMNQYGRDQYGNQKTVLTTFVKEHCQEYIGFIDKYLEWEAQASKDGDVISKPIGKAMGQIFNMHFIFHSGNANSHYLSIGLWGGDTQYFDRDGAIQLRELLEKYQQGKLKSVDIDNKYQ